MIKYFKLIVSFLILLFLLAEYQLIAQTRTGEDIRTRLEEYCRDIPWEEIFIHTDRDIYVAGEEMWFNSYLFDRQTGKLSSRSKVAYFELLNPDNVPVVQKRLLITDGRCPGNAHIPDTLTTGTYTFRIYTNWMKNFLPENAAMKSINIVNPFRNSGFKRKIIFEKHLPSKLNIAFYPEGGVLLNSIRGKVAVKASDEYQRGVVFNGIVRDSKGDSVASFTTDRYGLASFELTPANGNSYYVLYAGSVTYLPLASDEGCSLRADYLGRDLMTISLNRTGTSVNQNYSLLIQAHGNTSYFETFSIYGNNKTIVLPLSGLSPGINQITLFNQNRKPVCERLVLISSENNAGVPGLKTADKYGKREKVIVDLEKGQESVINSTFSISVTPRQFKTNYSGISDYLVFGTEFGYLPWNEPDEQAGEVTVNDFDNFLIGAKSRWISWEKVFSDNVASLDFMMEENAHLLSGLINERDKSVSEKDKVLTLSIPGKVASYYYAKASSSGQFEFMLPVDQIQKNLIIQPGSTDENISIEILPSYSRITSESVSFNDSVTGVISAAFSDLSARHQVNRIFEAAVKEEVQPDQSFVQSEKRFYGKPETQILMADFISLPVMQEIFFELAPGVRLRERKSGYDMRILNPFSNEYYNDPSTVLIDGVIINDLTILANLDPELVEEIDIVKTPYLTGDIVHNGIVHVITKSGKFNNLSLPEYAVKLPYRVTEPVPLFTFPDYSDAEKKKSRIPDFRNTLFWNPQVKSENGNKIFIEFWSSDLAGDYLIDIHGITSDGKPVSFMKVITIY
ncbi:MAG: hypothetical protein NTW82_08715 [Bacteroidia bacterium]|nr:hypothetical protein [Bacteroidia bacterium]